MTEDHPLDLPARAAEIVARLRDNGFPAEGAAQRQVLTLAEEVGEFVGAYRRWSGQARRTGSAEDVRAELADVVITAYVTAAELGIDLDRAIAAKLEVIFTRGWRENGAQLPDAEQRPTRG
jgi:NTP pyrophosphatase (non-canonical NTP hydrolase)